MSRVGRQPVKITSGVPVLALGDGLLVRSTRRQLQQRLHPAVRLNVAEGAVSVSVVTPEAPSERALWGLFRSLIQNMVDGVTTGFTKSLEFVGLGYKVSVSGSTVTMSLGFSHPVTMSLPPGITATVEKNTLTIEGSDKQLVGEVAAGIRRLRKPEPYKGKGVKYHDEVIRRKAGKAVKAVGK